MKLDLHFWAPTNSSEQDGRADVERQTREWAEAEPNVTACRIVKAERPYPDRPTWWIVTVDLDLPEVAADNMTLWGAA